VLVLFSLMLLLSLLPSCSHTSAEEQEYSRIASLSEQEAFRQAVQELRAEGVSVNFGSQPPYEKSYYNEVRPENNPMASNPTWSQVVEFLEADQTDSHVYLRGIYDCASFAETLHDAAEVAGIRCAFVAIRFVGDSVGHALNAVFTTDLGWALVNSMGRDGLDFLRPMDPASLLARAEARAQDPFADWSGDCVAYAAIGQELGFVHLQFAESLDYAFYQGCRSRRQAYELTLNQYNRDVQSYNDWVRGRVFYQGTPDASRMRSWSAELDARDAALQRERLTLGPVYQPMGIVDGIDVYF